MAMVGGCGCNNLRVTWQNVDYSLVPRACDCAYCAGHDAAWVSKSRSLLALSVQRPDAYRVLQQGSEQARFHECGHCEAVVAVSALIAGDHYGAVNIRCLRDAARFPPSRPVHLAGLGPADKCERWRRNWCCPFTVNVAAAKL